ASNHRVLCELRVTHVVNVARALPEPHFVSALCVPHSVLTWRPNGTVGCVTSLDGSHTTFDGAERAGVWAHTVRNVCAPPATVGSWSWSSSPASASWSSSTPSSSTPTAAVDFASVAPSLRLQYVRCELDDYETEPILPVFAAVCAFIDATRAASHEHAAAAAAG